MNTGEHSGHRRPRILHIVPSLGCGGMEKVLIDLMLSTSADIEHMVLSLSDDVVMAANLPSLVHLEILQKKDGYDWSIYPKIWRRLRALRPDIVHTYNFGTLEYQFIAKLAGCGRLVHVDHGLGGDPSDGKSAWRRWFRRGMSSLLDAYIVVSDDLKQWVNTEVGVPTRKIHLIRNGVKIPDASHSPERLPGVGLSLITVGRMVPVKNQQALIRVAARWNADHPENEPIHIYLVGDGVLRADLESLAIELDAVRTTHFCGMTLSPWDHVNKADAFILTSLYEAMPMTILESMSRACPVLCSSVGGIPDFISPAESMLFKGDDDDALYQAIDTLYAMPQNERRALGERGFNFVSGRYSQAQMVRQYLCAWLGK